MMSLFPGEEPQSYYSLTANAAVPARLQQGEEQCDVCIVGGGITGCSAALHLAQQGLKVIVLEARHIGYGASGRSGGQLIGGYNRDYSTLRALTGEADARALWDMGREAIDLTCSLVERHRIDCDLQRGHITAGHKPRHRQELEQTYADWTSCGHPGLRLLEQEEVRHLTGSPLYRHGLLDPLGGHLHPLNYTLGLAHAAAAAGVQFRQHSPLQGWREDNGSPHSPRQSSPLTIQTPDGQVRASYLILAGNAYLWQTVRSLGRRIMPVGTYMVATAPLPEDTARALLPTNAAVADMDAVLNYYRLSADRRMLFGGGVSYSRLDPPDLAAHMGKTMRRVLPALRETPVTHAWGGYVAITVNRLPHLGRLSPRVLFAHGYSGHGIALAGLAGKLLSDAVAGQAGGLDLFSRIPHMPFPGGQWLRTPALVLAMAWHRLRDML